MTSPTVGSCVLAMRRKAGLTQEDLASKSGLSRGQIANLETDRTDLSIKALMRVAEALGVSAGGLLP